MPPAAAALTFTYSVESRGDVEADFGEFTSTVASILSDDRGWTLDGAISLSRVASGGNFTVVLAGPAQVDAAHPACSPTFSCRVGDQVLLNDLRWRAATDAWTGTLAGYRTYLVNHEVGHWLGLGHRSCPQAGAPAPVMQQQSISLQGCAPNGWPLDAERRRVAGIWASRSEIRHEPGRADPRLVLGLGPLVPGSRRVRGRGVPRPGSAAGRRAAADPRLGLAPPRRDDRGGRRDAWPALAHPAPHLVLDLGPLVPRPRRVRGHALPRIPDWGWERLRVLLGGDVEEE